VERKRNLPEGNQRRRFHGTNRACDLGDNGSTTLCNFKLSQCSLCSIVRTSYKLSKAGANKPWLFRSTGRQVSCSFLRHSLSFEFVGLGTVSIRLLHPPSAADLYLCRFISLTHSLTSDQMIIRRTWVLIRLTRPCSLTRRVYPLSPSTLSKSYIPPRKVVVGKGIKLRNDQPNLTEPPAGYDSVRSSQCLVTVFAFAYI
jgi:hypothetical protein